MPHTLSQNLVYSNNGLPPNLFDTSCSLQFSFRNPRGTNDPKTGCLSQWSLRIKVNMQKTASGCSLSPAYRFWLRCTRESRLFQKGALGEADLRNTGELDLDNSSGRTCFFSPTPFLASCGVTNPSSIPPNLPTCRLTRLLS